MQHTPKPAMTMREIREQLGHKISEPTPPHAPWVDGDPLMEAIASAAWDHCRTEGPSCVVDDPRNIAAAVAEAARAVLYREAADVAESLRQFERCTGPRRAAQTSENVGILRVAEELRRQAAACPTAPAARPAAG